MRTLGVEEELLIVDPSSGAPLPLGGSIVEIAHRWASGAPFTVTTELQSEQVECVSAICDGLDAVEASIRAGRACADDIARTLGSRIVALGTSPVTVEPHILPVDRYQEIEERFGLTAREQLTCGFHVHVAVESADEGVAVLDRIRVWLPVLLALSVNSPFWNGQVTGYASFRRQVLSRLPLAGATEQFGSAERYRDLIDRYVATKVIIDAGMVYFDARLSQNHPTVEIRVADVCLDVDTAVLIAGLTRALVETAALEWRLDVPPISAGTSLVNLAMWRAGRDGLDGCLLEPGTWKPRPAAVVIDELMQRIGPALNALGDAERIGDLLDRHIARGSGAARQREVFARVGDLSDVVTTAIALTHRPPEPRGLSRGRGGSDQIRAGKARAAV